MNICVYGAASDIIDKSYIDTAYEMGRMMAERGLGLVYGGGASGVMGAVSRGVRDGGGRILGVVPEFFVETGFEKLADYNTETIFTPDMDIRRKTMHEHSDAYIMLPGGIGTYVEFFDTLERSQLQIDMKPIAVYNPGCFDNMKKMLDDSLKEGFIRENINDLYFMSDNFEEVLDYIEYDVPKKEVPVMELKYGKQS